MFFGTIINTAAVIIGSSVGLIFRNKFPERLKLIIFQGLGLCTLTIGISMSLKTQNIIAVIFSILLGGILGELVHLQENLDQLGDKLKSRLKSKNPTFTEGWVSASVLFCVGAMTIMGTFEEGVKGEHTILLTKSMLDGFASIALAATFGGGVIFSALSVLVVQVSLTMLATSAQSFFTPLMISQITGTGGILVMIIGINLLEIKKIKTANFLPALLIIAVFCILGWK